VRDDERVLLDGICYLAPKTLGRVNPGWYPLTVFGTASISSYINSSKRCRGACPTTYPLRHSVGCVRYPSIVFHIDGRIGKNMMSLWYFVDDVGDSR
jgi:hypothetical protein